MIKSCSKKEGDLLEVYIVGSFHFEKYSWENVNQIVAVLQNSGGYKLELKLFHVLSLNTEVRETVNYPKLQGIVFDVDKGEICGAEWHFNSRGPDMDLRGVACICGTSPKLRNIFDNEKKELLLSKFEYQMIEGVEYLLMAERQWLLENMSTSPLAEKKEFVDYLLHSFSFLAKNPSHEAFWKENGEGRRYKLVITKEGIKWERCPHNK